MFRKMLAASGVGGARVDTVIDNPSLCPGDTLRGTVEIFGGNTRQTIEYVDLVLMAEVEREASENEVRGAMALARYRVGGSTTVGEGQTLHLNFNLDLPLETPVNNSRMLASPGSKQEPYVRAAVWLHTDLALARAIDAKDRDWLDIQPLPQMQALIQAMAALGYWHTSADIEHGTARIGNISSSIGCYQEFEFRPAPGRGSRIAEVEITCVPRPDGMHVLMEIDRRLRGDGYRSFVMGNDWASVNWERQLRQLLA